MEETPQNTPETQEVNTEPTTTVQESSSPEVSQEETAELKRNWRKERVGVVVSNKMNKSIVVSVRRRLKHSKYGKFVTKTKNFIAHDEQETCNIGDTVRIMETRPLSKHKRWRLVEIVERAK